MASTATAEFAPETPGPSGNLTAVSAKNAAGGGEVDVYDWHFAPVFPLPSTAIEAAGVLSAYAGPFAMGVYARIDDPQVWFDSYASVVQYFSVDVSKGAYFEWDLTLADSSNSRALFSILGVGPIYSYGLGTSGSIELILEPGLIYLFIGRIDHENPNPGDVGYVNLIWKVPAPGTLALLGLGMLGVKRRRRE